MLGVILRRPGGTYCGVGPGEEARSRIYEVWRAGKPGESRQPGVGYGRRSQRRLGISIRARDCPLHRESPLDAGNWCLLLPSFGWCPASTSRSSKRYRDGCSVLRNRAPESPPAVCGMATVGFPATFRALKTIIAKPGSAAGRLRYPVKVRLRSPGQPSIFFGRLLKGAAFFLVTRITPALDPGHTAVCGPGVTWVTQLKEPMPWL